MPSGYSGTPLAMKLGIKPGFRIAVVGSPGDYRRLVPDLAPSVTIEPKPTKDLDLIHVFAVVRRDLAKQLPVLMKKIQPNGTIWVSWPKRASKVETDITEDVIRAVCLPLGSST
jgi:hypothetical protein